MIRLSSRAWWIGLAAIALVAAGIRIAIREHLRAIGAGPIADARALEMLAWNVLDGVGFRDVVAFWPEDAPAMPLFPVFLAGVQALFGESRLAVELVLGALSVTTCLALAGIGRLAFASRATGLTAGFLAAIYVPFAAVAAELVPEAFFAFLVAVGAYLLLRGALERGRGFALASGAVFGGAALVRLSALAAAPALLLATAWLAVEAGRTRRIAGRILIPWTFAMLAVFSVWPIRNAIVLGTFLPGSSEGLARAWAIVTDAGVDETGARRAVLWREPEATERERAIRLGREIESAVFADAGRVVGSAARQAGRRYEPPPLPRAWEGDPLRPAWAVEVWLFARIGAAGIVVALFRRFAAGLLLGGVLVSLATFDLVSGGGPFVRLARESVWILGAAYLLVLLVRIHREVLLAADARDRDPDPPFSGSLFDRHGLVAPLAAAVALPFLALAVVAPIRRATLASTPEAPPPHARDAKPPAVYRALAAAGAPEAIRHPPEFVAWSGEVSHFVARADGMLGSFSLRVGKSGLAVGEAHVLCAVAPGVAIPVPDGLRRFADVRGTIAGAGPLGEPVVAVEELVTR